MQNGKIVAALEPVIDDGRGLAVLVEQKAGIVAAEFLVELNEEIAGREIEHARHDQNRRGERHARGIVDRGQAGQDGADGLGVTFGKIPRHVGDGAQHRIEHDRARPVCCAEGTADRAVIVGDKGDRERVERDIIGWIARRRGEDAVEHDAVFMKQPRVVDELGELFLSPRIVR